MTKYILLCLILVGCASDVPKQAVPLDEGVMHRCEKQLKWMLICYPLPTKATT